LNGFIDAYLYAAGLIDGALPFDELRARYHINAAARDAADAEDFPERIRVGLPTIRPSEPATTR